ncbi:M20 metallopeptidase family protein [Pseudogemmobacter faecipullorum]|uniref:Amidohydrolase n=1 Tax=Pseudogemmobacter faecipullorum TaxID=2755041 RepID=A0ABS8CNE2_9RHOB|nr:amidohydrolase [Pseudogemmobacter faecipullorum]MCB5410892.1 amidohydrolase [Pseudogemmobacter faecipullorum]
MREAKDALAWLAQNHDRFCAIRRAFHQTPEIGFDEVATAKTLAAHLAALGCVISRPIGGTGFVATLHGGPGRAVALRTDMDALPQSEETGLAYASQNPGRMHACGHDGHMTLMLATAELLAAAGPLPGPVHFICQPAEELGQGADRMIADGLFDEIDPALTFGYHNWPQLPVGVVSARAGAIMAAYREIRFSLTGRGGHAALPQLSDDIYGALAALITRMNARMRTELAGTAFAFTRNLSGTAANIIPDRLGASASFRFVSPEQGEQAGVIAEDVAREIAAGFGISVSAEVTRVFNLTRNDAAATALVAEVVGASAGDLIWQEAPSASMVAEDFGTMIEDRPGCYFWLGAGMERGSLHNSRFDFNEALLLTAPQLLADLLRKALERV